MARYPAEHKEQVRARILAAAASRFNRDGIDGSGIAALMADAGLTNGAFYAHFESKEHLVAVVLADAVRRQREAVEALPPTVEAALGFVAAYLSPEHRDDSATGCPSAALLDEIARSSAAVRQVYADEVTRLLDVVAERLSDRDPATARADATALFALLVGTVQLARSMTDEATSRAVLEAGRRQAEAIVQGGVSTKMSGN